MSSRRFVALAILTLLLVIVVAPTAYGQDRAIPLRLQVPIPGFSDAQGNVDGGITSLSLAKFIRALYIFFFYAGGILATVMIVWAGFLWLTSAGSSERVTTAKSYISGAVAGLVLLFGAYTILSLLNPSLTELRRLEMPRINPVSTAFFCDDRTTEIAQSKYPPDKLEFLFTQAMQDNEERAINPERYNDPPTATQATEANWKDIWVDASAAKCGAAYVVSEIRGGKRKAASGSACYGRNCNNSAFACLKVPHTVMFQCVNADIVADVEWEGSAYLDAGVQLIGLCNTGTIFAQHPFTYQPGQASMRSDEYIFDFGSPYDITSEIQQNCNGANNVLGYYLKIEVNDDSNTVLATDDDIFYVGEDGCNGGPPITVHNWTDPGKFESDVNLYKSQLMTPDRFQRKKECTIKISRTGGWAAR